MSTEPYVPSAGTVRVAYRNRRPGSAYFLGVTNQDPDAEFDRFIAKINADALREAALMFSSRLGSSYSGVAVRGMLDDRADRIEEEA